MCSSDLEVAAVSHALARHRAGLNPDEAMMAGLLHDIGVLPVVMHAAKRPELQARKALEPVIARLHGRIGRRILESWNFAPALVEVADGHEELSRAGADRPDYTDIVLVANLYCHRADGHPLGEVDWTQVPAAARLGLASAEEIAESPQLAESISDARALLGLSPGAAPPVARSGVAPKPVPASARRDPAGVSRREGGFLRWLRRLFGFAPG